jgi:hypothetical protein
VKHENVSKEPVMATPNTPGNIKTATPALFSLALPFLPAALDQACIHFDHLLCGLLSAVLQHLPSIMVAGGETVGTYLLTHAQIFECAETVVSILGVARMLGGLS